MIRLHHVPRIAAAFLAIAAMAGGGAAQESAHHKIGIIGAGNVGGTLGRIWAKAGDEVMFASRHPDDLKELAAKAGPHAKVGTPAQAAAFGDVVLIAVPYSAFPDIAKANVDALKGKVVFDASNALKPRDGAIVEEVHAKGIGAYSAGLLPGVHLVRGFNAIHFTNMETDANKDIAVPLASDDETAVKTGSELVREAGFVPVVVPLKRAAEIGPQRPLGSGSFTEKEWKQKLGLDK